MKPQISTTRAHREVFIEEGCFITESWNVPEDEAVSIARARVAPATSTVNHVLDVDERYIIISGRGVIELDGISQTVSVGDIVVIPAGTPQRIHNVGHSDLVFYCVCTPRFTTKHYRKVDC